MSRQILCRAERPSLLRHPCEAVSTAAAETGLFQAPLLRPLEVWISDRSSRAVRRICALIFSPVFEISFVARLTKRCIVGEWRRRHAVRKLRLKSFRLNDHKAQINNGHLFTEATKGSGIRRFLRFTRSAYIEEAIISSDFYNAVDSLLFSVWREVIGASAEVRFGRLAATVKWDDGIAAADQGLLRLLNASKFGWCDAIDGFVARAKDEVRRISVAYGMPVKGGVSGPTSVDRLCTRCVFCSPRAVDHSEQL